MYNFEVGKQEQIPNDMLNIINIISGAYTSSLVDTADELSSSKNALPNMQSIIRALLECKKVDEAMKFIHLLYDLCGLEFPEEITLLEKHELAREQYLNEFLLDLEDLKYDYDFAMQGKDELF